LRSCCPSTKGNQILLSGRFENFLNLIERQRQSGCLFACNF
jgi:hypothetical protein